jgi:hypothetical protein
MNKTGWWTFFSILLVIVATVPVLINVPPLTGCRSEAPVVARQYWFRAAQIVVQPWLGPHHVYGVFSVPVQYGRDRLYTARLMIQGLSEELPGVTPEGVEALSERVDLGHYIKHAYLPTRTALWFLLTGRFGDLKMTCHWWLVIEDRVG